MMNITRIPDRNDTTFGHMKADTVFGRGESKKHEWAMKSIGDVKQDDTQGQVIRNNDVEGIGV